MERVYEKIYDLILKQKDCTLVTIIDGKGSTPRGAGAHMLVDGDNNSFGTIGGGAVEYRAHQMAYETLKNKQACIKSFMLRPNDIEDLGMICGGDVEVYMQYIPCNAQTADLFKKITECSKLNKNTWLITKIGVGQQCEMWVIQDEEVYGGTNLDLEYINLLGKKNTLIEFGGSKFYIEPLTKTGIVYIFGGGHISRKILPILNFVGFECIVFDDNDKFTKSNDFEGAKSVIKGDFKEVSKYITVDEGDYVVIVTRGHENDYTVLKQVLNTKAAYIGMIGSKSKVLKTKERLTDDGFKNEDLERIFSPIGINIKAETPEEIAISITAEIISTRAEKRYK